MKPCNKTKVLFILPTLCSGGAERILITLMNNTNREIFSPEFLVLDESGEMKEWIADDIPFHSFGKRSIKGSIFKLISFIRKNQPDEIFTTMVHCNGLVLLMKIIFPHIRVIVREAALPSSILSEYGIKGRLCLFVYKYLYPKADIVLSNCSQVFQEFETNIRLNMKNHRILFNPVDIDWLFGEMPQKFKCPDDREDTVRFVCVGRLSYEKGYDRLIQSLKNFECKKNWRLDIIGEGDYRTELETLIKSHKLEKHVFLRGYHPNPWKIAAQADCQLLPSRWEGMPNVILEGFACGVPAIGVREAGGISDIAKYTDDQNLLVFDTIEEIVEAMKDVVPQAKESCSSSILPKEFSLSYAMEQFEKILKPTQKSLH